MKQTWGQLYYQDGTLKYTGFINQGGSPEGSGTQFYRDGTVYKEGIWGRKGLLSGREHYPNGQIRFEGVYRYNQGYGPNYPIYGNFYARTGELVYEGLFKIHTSGLGWPFVICPDSYGNVVLDEDPRNQLEKSENLHSDPE